MKKIAILFVIFLGSFFLFSKIHPSQTIQQATLGIAQTSPTSTPTPTPVPIGTPETISIPAIGINTHVEQVGLDPEGRMGVPENSTDTAWFKEGYKPGEKGSAVIDGHFDTVTGAPAVFYNITKLQKGDTITVTDSLNNTYNYSVEQVISYPDNQFPLHDVFASTDKARLNLITCDGVWNRAQHNYSNRAVVYSVLEQ